MGGKIAATVSTGANIAAVDADNNFFGGGDVSNYRDGFADTADLYTITKIWTAQMTSTTASKEDRYRITVDKNINWDGSTISNPDFRDSTSTRATCRSSSSRRRRRARSLTSRSARTAASATATTRSASASRATPTTTATRRARSLCKAQARGLKSR